MDIDVNAVEVTKLSLLLKCLEGETEASIQQQFSLWNERVLPTLDNNIKSGNSLIDTDFYAAELDFGLEKKIKPFNWKGAFPDVFKQGGFDAVIGNPPYGAAFNQAEKDYLTKKYTVSEGNYESFSFFIEISENILRLKGLIGFIIPDTWFTLKSSYKLRRFTITELSICEIQMLNENIFKSAKVDVCTFLLIKDKEDEPFNVYVYDKDATENEIHNGEYVTVNSFSKQDILDDQELSFRFKQAKINKSIIQKISHQKNKLEDYCIIGSGCKPYEIGKGTPPQTKGMVEKKVYNSNFKLNHTYRLLLRGADIGRYSPINKSDEWLSYGVWLAAPRNPELFNNPRLLFQSIRNPKLKRRLVGTFVQDESVNNNSITNIILKDETKSLKFFLGILNSDLMNWYFSVSYNIVNIDPRYLKMAPIPFTDNAKETEIISLVDDILNLYENVELIKLQTQIDLFKSKIAYCENRINELVYNLYGLTEEEVRIVEGMD